jgi:hypothetical protein
MMTENHIYPKIEMQCLAHNYSLHFVKLQLIVGTIFFFFFLLLFSFDSSLVDIPCIVSGIGSILLFFPLTYTLDTNCRYYVPNIFITLQFSTQKLEKSRKIQYENHFLKDKLNLCLRGNYCY